MASSHPRRHRPIWMPRVLMGLILVLGLVITTESTAAAAPVPGGFTDTTISGLNAPTAMAMLPDGRVLVAEQTGALRGRRGRATPPAAVRDADRRFHRSSVD